MPIGMILLTIGLFHWHREQQAINQQMEKRERVFREHRLFDKLTPLGGAGYLKHQVSDCLAQSVEQQQPLSLLALDIDDFTSINQHYGHAEGDLALKAFADVLRIAFRESDVIGRLGGDEFVVLLTGSDCVHIAAVMARLQALLDERNASASRGYAIRFSVGQIEYDPQHHDSVASLLLDADRAMYIHKQTLKRG